MSKTIDATLGERLAAITLLNNGKFNNSTLAVVLEDIKKVAITEEEWTAANLVKTPSDEAVKAMDPEDAAKATQTWKWDENATKTIEFQKGTADALLAMIKEKSDANELTLSDGNIITLQAKLEA